MRFVILIAFFAVAFGCRGTKNLKTSAAKLDGTWTPVKEEMAGTNLPSVAFAKQVLIIQDTTYTFTAESVDKGVMKYAGDKMDIYGKEGVNKGKHITAIYKYENEELTICYNLAGDSYPKNFDSKGNPRYFVAVFKKQSQ
jgi:uncharacterized protein (TIGR03067 family)